MNQKVLDCFALCSNDEIAQAVTEASIKLLSRAPTGEFWGAGSGVDHRSTVRGPSSAALTQYQLVHRAVESKLNAHKALIELVSVSVSPLI